MQNIKTNILLILCALLISCATSPTPKEIVAKLYPSNEIASQTGLISGSLIPHSKVSGEVIFITTDDERLAGEYKNLDSPPEKSWSRSLGTALLAGAGPEGREAASRQADLDSKHSADKTKTTGVMSMYGNHGTALQCEYNYSYETKNGIGTCKSSSGAEYLIHF